MYAWNVIRTRKPLHACTPDHQRRRNRLYERAREAEDKWFNELHQAAVVNAYPNEAAATSNENCRIMSQNEIIACLQFSNSDDNISIAGQPSSHDEEELLREHSPRAEIDSGFSKVNEDCDSISSRTNSELDESLEDFEARLASVFAEVNMNHRQIRRVLLALKTHRCFTNIHVDPRTIMKTPAVSCFIANVAGGEYLHLGVRKGLLNVLQTTPFHMIPNFLEVDFSTDEASLDSDSKILMWPIQIRIANILTSSPEVVGIFQGSKKPLSATEFFQPFVADLLAILESGIEFNGVELTVKLRCFIADAPARAFSLDHRGHNSKVPCSKCYVIGESVRPGVIVFKGTNHRLRTQEEYSSRIDMHHHISEESPLGALPLNLVSNTVFDYMHLICLGVMEKILVGVIDGRFVESAQLSNNDKLVLNDRLEQVKKYCPQDFARKPVSIDKHGKFKATEQRQILLYSGPVVFNGLVNVALYDNFLLLHIAMRILANPLHTMESVTLAEDCIKAFVETCSDVYGIEFLSYNTHALLHLPDDVRSFGALDSFSAFPYENNMTYFRKLCRKPNQQFQQIFKRRAENVHTATKKYVDPTSLKFIRSHTEGPVPQIEDIDRYKQYKKVVTGAIHLSTSQADSTVILRDGSIGVIKNIIEYENNSCYLLLKLFSNVDDFFKLPCNSSLINVFLCSTLSTETIFVGLNQVVGKCFRMPYWPPDIPTKECSSEYFVVTVIISTHLDN